MEPRPENPHLQALLAEAPFLHRLAKSLCASGSDSDELVQETWLVALRNPPSHLASVRGWLASTLRGRLHNRRRREARLVRREQAVAREEMQPQGVPEIEALEAQARLLSLVRSLPEDQRKVILLRFYEQLSPPEIAGRLDLNPSTVRTRLSRGLAQLREQLDRETQGGRRGWMAALAPIGMLPLPAPLPVVAAFGAPVLMKKIVLAVSAFVLAGFGIHALLGLDKEDLEPSQSAHERPSSLADLAGLAGFQSPADGLQGDVESGGRSAVELAPPIATLKVAAVSGCQVFGRLFDADEQPMQGVSVKLRSYQEWSAEADAILLRAEPPYFGWEKITGQDGTFRFEVPMPTSKYISVVITPGDYFESKTLNFGGTREGKLDPLELGARDLGTIRLLGAGSVSGRVTDAFGVPVQGVRVGTGTHSGNSCYHSSDTDAQGCYRCVHVLPGTLGVSAVHQRYVSQFLEPYSIEAGREITDVDFVLVGAPSMQGRVRNQAGAFLAGVEISCWPDGSGTRAGALSGSDGGFVVYLPQDDAHSIRATLEGYQPWGLDHGGEMYAPGTADLEIVMQPDIATEFFVVDNKTGKPVERYGLRIERDKGELADPRDPSSRFDAPHARARDGGLVETYARPGIDRYWLYAPGFLESRGEIQHDDGDSGRQTIELSRGASFQGRIVKGGKPQAGIPVRLTPVGLWFASPPGASLLHVGIGPLKTMVFDWDETLASKTDEDGAFTFSGVKKGQSYHLEANGKGEQRVRLLPLDHPGRGNVDLGNLELEAVGSVQAQVVAPTGVEVERMQFYLDGWKDGNMVVPTKQGTLSIEGLSPGLHLLTLKNLPGFVVGGKRWSFELEPGEAKEFTLDLSDRGLCEVSVHVDAGELPVKGLKVFLRPEPTPGALGEFMGVGNLDSKGHVKANVLACGSARLYVSGRTFERVEIPTEHLDFSLGSEHHLEFKLELGSAKMVLPKDIPWAENTLLWFEGEHLDANIRIENGKPQTPETGLECEGTEWVRLLHLSPGTHTLSLLVMDLDREDPNSRTGDVVLWQGKRTVQIEQDGTTEVVW